jgi:flagellar hook-associated protein 2
VGNAASIDELAEIGISTGAPTGTTLVADNVNGKLVFDETKFRKALIDDPASVERLLKGAATSLEAKVTPLTDTGGLLDGRISAANGELSLLKDSLTRMDERLERKETFLRKQFTALETAMQRSSSVAADLAARLGTSTT